MAKTKLSSKGQVVIPKSLRDQYQWAPGLELAVEPAGSGVLLRPVSSGRRSVDGLLGILKHAGPPKTLRDMDEGVVREVKARHARGRY